MANNDTICRTCIRLCHGLCDGEKELTACPWYETKENYKEKKITRKEENGRT